MHVVILDHNISQNLISRESDSRWFAGVEWRNFTIRSSTPWGENKMMTLIFVFLRSAALVPPAESSETCSTPALEGYTCYPGFCASDSVVHHPVPQCGPQLAEKKFGGSTIRDRLTRAKTWCEANGNCTGFAVDPNFAITLMFNSTNFTKAGQPNKDWNAYWAGGSQPLPPRPPSPAPGLWGVMTGDSFSIMR